MRCSLVSQQWGSGQHAQSLKLPVVTWTPTSRLHDLVTSVHGADPRAVPLRSASEIIMSLTDALDLRGSCALWLRAVERRPPFQGVRAKQSESVHMAVAFAAAPRSVAVRYGTWATLTFTATVRVSVLPEGLVVLLAQLVLLDRDLESAADSYANGMALTAVAHSAEDIETGRQLVISSCAGFSPVAGIETAHTVATDQSRAPRIPDR